MKNGPVASLINIDEVATILGVSRRTIYRMSSTGELPPRLRVGRSVRWRRSDIEQFIANDCQVIDSERKGVA